MVFGEILEPSSRALWDEEGFEDFVPNDDEIKQISWKGNDQVPSTIEKFIICETSCILNIISNCATNLTKPICELEKVNGRIYQLNESSCYVFTFKSDPNVIIGNVTEKLIPWLNVSKSTFIVTSAPLITLQNDPFLESHPCTIRMLSTEGIQNYPKLNTPNLVTGLSASILSYCIFKKLMCSLYVTFLDKEELDSVNTEPVIILLKQIGLGPLASFTSKFKPPSNNLYM